MQGLRIRKLADRSQGERVKKFNPDTGEPYLVNPKTGEPEAWPLLGISIEGDTPDKTRVAMRFVSRGRVEGWLTVEGYRVKHEPGGPLENPWAITHSFENGDAIILSTVDGEVRYKITHNPGKYDDPSEASGKRVDWFFDLEREA